MGINLKILEKLKKYTEEEEIIRKYIIELITYELDSPGWYENEYLDRLEKILNSIKG